MPLYVADGSFNQAHSKWHCQIVIIQQGNEISIRDTREEHEILTLILITQCQIYIWSARKRHKYKDITMP